VPALSCPDSDVCEAEVPSRSNEAYRAAREGPDQVGQIGLIQASGGTSFTGFALRNVGSPSRDSKYCHMALEEVWTGNWIY
jgi:hypothetical protein